MINPKKLCYTFYIATASIIGAIAIGIDTNTSYLTGILLIYIVGAISLSLSLLV